MRVSAAGNMPLQGLVNPPAKPVVMILYRGMIEQFLFFSKQNRNKSTRSKLHRGA